MDTCPQGFIGCASQRNIVELEAATLDGAAVRIAWRWSRAAEAGAVIGLYGGPPVDACACLLSCARLLVIDLLDRPQASDDDLAELRLLLAQAGCPGEVVIAVSSERRPPWMAN